MSISTNFLRSLLLTITFSFVAPLLLVGGLLFSLSLSRHLPGLDRAAQAITEQILQFLATFGSGCPLQGLVAIGLTCSFVGALFDTYSFYRYKSFRSH